MAISMADYKRSIKCSGCGNEITVYMNGNFDLTELSAVGRCQNCKTLIQLDFAIVERVAPSEGAPVAENAGEEQGMNAFDMFSEPANAENTCQQAAKNREEVEGEEDTSELIKDLMSD
jgi:hypothetical protein